MSLACLRCFAGKLSMCSMMVFSGGQLIFDRNAGQLMYDSVSVPSMSKMMARIVIVRLFEKYGLTVAR